ncbi:MAG: JAB domain-containing protein [Roseburia sp.]
MSQDYELEMVSVRLTKEQPLLSAHQIRTPEDALEIIGEFLREMDREMLCVINLKTDGTPINGHIATTGALDQTIAHPRELLKTAILSNAASMIMVHCHPSGNLEPSQADILLTERMVRVCELMGIPLRDHIIFGAGRQEYFSFMEHRMLDADISSNVLMMADQRTNRRLKR